MEGEENYWLIPPSPKSHLVISFNFKTLIFWLFQPKKNSLKEMGQYFTLRVINTAKKMYYGELKCWNISSFFLFQDKIHERTSLSLAKQIDEDNG